ncbi:hypothetical protein EJ08DRAFT_675517 [Tothia fuscella]|uniref:RRM domain-containing protein n=1 Tax=Tothia fuscella TaxID=1048955 RepID=A0A9P4P1U6_9PEZI|nr:hypothetical protein EJ08DRAFT_675517 [Tothia fuscella]
MAGHSSSAMNINSSSPQQQHPSAMYQYHPPANEMEWLKHQLHERDLRIQALESAVNDKNVTVARMEERLEFAKSETQSALRTAMLACSANGGIYYNSTSVGLGMRFENPKENLKIFHLGAKENEFGRHEKASDSRVPPPDTSQASVESDAQSNLRNNLTSTQHVRRNAEKTQARRESESSKPPESNFLTIKDHTDKSATKTPPTPSSEGSSSSESKRQIPSFIHYIPVPEVVPDVPNSIRRPISDPMIALPIQGSPPQDFSSELTENYPNASVEQIPAYTNTKLEFNGVLTDSTEDNTPHHSFERSSSPSPESDFDRGFVTPRGPRAGFFNRDEHSRGNFDRRDSGYGGYRRQHQEFSMDKLAYKPKPGDSDVYRTVMISNLPTSITMKAILDYAVDYPIVSAHLLDTSKMKIQGGSEMGTVTIRLLFFHQSSAEQFTFDFSATTPPSFSGLTPIMTHLTSSPTYPLTPSFKCLQAPGRLFTRRIKINNPRADLVHPQRFPEALGGFSRGFREKGWIVEIREDKGRGVLEVVFNGVETAIYAYGRLRDGGVFGGCDPVFVRDYGGDGGQGEGFVGEGEGGKDGGDTERKDFVEVGKNEGEEIREAGEEKESGKMLNDGTVTNNEEKYGRAPESQHSTAKPATIRRDTLLSPPPPSPTTSSTAPANDTSVTIQPLPSTLPHRPRRGLSQSRYAPIFNQVPRPLSTETPGQNPVQVDISTAKTSPERSLKVYEDVEAAPAGYKAPTSAPLEREDREVTPFLDY